MYNDKLVCDVGNLHLTIMNKTAQNVTFYLDKPYKMDINVHIYKYLHKKGTFTRLAAIYGIFLALFYKSSLLSALRW